MSYWSVTFTPEQWRAVLLEGVRAVEVSLRSARLQSLAAQVRADDAFACYVLRRGEWVGVLRGLRVELSPTHLRIETEPVAAVDLDVGLRTTEIRDRLSFLRHTRMAGFVQSPLRSLPTRDGEELGRLLTDVRQGFNPEWTSAEEEFLEDYLETRDMRQTAALHEPSRIERRSRTPVVRMPQLKVGEEEIRAGQTFDMSFHLEVLPPLPGFVWARAGGSAAPR